MVMRAPFPEASSGCVSGKLRAEAPWCMRTASLSYAYAAWISFSNVPMWQPLLACTVTSLSASSPIILNAASAWVM